MGATVVMCTECNKAHRYRSAEMENIGTEWHPIWLVSCPHCGHKMSLDWGNIDLMSQPLPPKNRDAYARAESSDIREYWIQKYVQENYDKLGFSHIEGPFEFGLDFRGIYRGRKAVVEVERDCHTYVIHRHHENSAFKAVNTLIVLNPSKPPEEVRCKLPKKVIYIDIDDFVEWWCPKAKQYAKTKRIQRIVDAIAGEFHRRFVSECGDKDRDMSVCPECDLCPYFGEGICSEATPAFQRIAFEFIALYEHPITSDDFKLSDVDSSEIDDFWHSALLA